MPFLPPNQQRQSTEGRSLVTTDKISQIEYDFNDGSQTAT